MAMVLVGAPPKGNYSLFENYENGHNFISRCVFYLAFVFLCTKNCGVFPHFSFKCTRFVALLSGLRIRVVFARTRVCRRERSWWCSMSLLILVQTCLCLIGSDKKNEEISITIIAFPQPPQSIPQICVVFIKMQTISFIIVLATFASTESFISQAIKGYVWLWLYPQLSSFIPTSVYLHVLLFSHCLLQNLSRFTCS